MAAQVFGSLDLHLFRRLKSIYCSQFSFKTLKYTFPDRLTYCSHFLSKSSSLTNKSGDSNSFEEPARHGPEERKDGQRGDLERLKKLLVQGKSRSESNKRDQQLEPSRTRTKAKRMERKPPVNVSKFKDILSALSLKQGPSLSSSEGITLAEKPHALLKEDKTIKEETSPRQISHIKAPQLPSVDVTKFKDALSRLGQDDGSSPPSEDVLLAGRHRKISSDRLAAMDGMYNIKQRQLGDKNIRKKMLRNSLRTGPRFHWFDDVKTKWTDEQLISAPSIFQEMAEKEVKDLGLSTSAQSGFRDLIENVHRQWAFPIDNETCKTEEEDVGFDEHVFLEYLLDEFPKSGNIRQFMELVITGLQQNPHLNVQEKKEHVLWFKDYFENIVDENVQM